MSVLPQRKRTPEELNQLRDQLGIRPPVAPSSSAPAKNPEESASPTSSAASAGAKPPRSLKRAERDTPLTRKPANAPYSKLPARRHSDAELQEIRRREALARFDIHGKPSLLPKAAPLWLLIPGYLLAGFGLACHQWPEIPMEATAGTGAAALAAAAFIGLGRPLSRHHAGFIAIITLFALVFATLHYFPHLRHAS